MAQSSITSKNQTTVPKEVRDRLGTGPGDVLQWDVENGQARVRPAAVAFLRWRGAVEVGRGSTVDDVRRARATRGAEDD
ncbi:MAG: AbrB/MazE/SpoVT family DNA-binding domain-containing protein [Acidobacteriota bacterium]|nr:AbrB/MazE/SpoVT family DNA-binding domain-containing protein [Acidobacteriota bacterium]MDH3525733.1 AbrB/MazE/SpoVT family DNA-binding domain-containing protein [Acidobacteriota bacterium]